MLLAPIELRHSPPLPALPALPAARLAQDIAAALGQASDAQVSVQDVQPGSGAATGLVLFLVAPPASGTSPTPRELEHALSAAAKDTESRLYLGVYTRAVVAGAGGGGALLAYAADGTARLAGDVAPSFTSGAPPPSSLPPTTSSHCLFSALRVPSPSSPSTPPIHPASAPPPPPQAIRTAVTSSSTTLSLSMRAAPRPRPSMSPTRAPLGRCRATPPAPPPSASLPARSCPPA